MHLKQTALLITIIFLMLNFGHTFTLYGFEIDGSNIGQINSETIFGTTPVTTTERTTTSTIASTTTTTLPSTTTQSSRNGLAEFVAKSFFDSLEDGYWIVQDGLIDPHDKSGDEEGYYNFFKTTTRRSTTSRRQPVENEDEDQEQ